jgi:hypothetical protein
MRLGYVKLDTTIPAGKNDPFVFVAHNITDGLPTPEHGRAVGVIAKTNFPISTDVLSIGLGPDIYDFVFTGFNFADPLSLDPYSGGSEIDYLRSLCSQINSHPAFVDRFVARPLYYDVVSTLGAFEIRAIDYGSSYEVTLAAGLFNTIVFDAKSYNHFANRVSYQRTFA